MAGAGAPVAGGAGGEIPAVTRSASAGWADAAIAENMFVGPAAWL
jgi:hypothetical protein